MRITQRELDRYRSQIASRQDDARAYVLARLQSEARGMTVAEAREASIGIMKDCLAVYGDQAQALSAELFDEICEAEGIDAEPGAMFDDVVDESRLSEKVHYYAGKLQDGDWDGYAGSNADLAAYYVHRSALQNIVRNCRRNGVKYARVPTGRETCGYCFMLSSRRFDYSSEKTASAASHPHCDCVIVPGVNGVTKIDGYDPDGMKSRLAAIEKQCGAEAGNDWKQNAVVTGSMKLRDGKWLYSGKEPDIKYADESVIKKKNRNKTEREQRALERKTAARLNKSGIETVFIDDERVNDDGTTTGLPDLMNGIELKTVYKASSENTVRKHIGKCKGKDGLKAIVVDVSENPNMDDATALIYVRRSFTRHKFKKPVYLLSHDGSLMAI